MTDTTTFTPDAPPVPTGKAQMVDTKSFVFWVMVAAIVYAGANLFDKVTSSIVVKASPANAWLALVEWAIYGAIFLAVVYTHQLFVRRSPWVTVGALLWGGLVGVWFASIANAAANDVFTRWFSVGFNDRWGAALAAATNEEVLKTLGVVALALLPLAGVRTTLDGWFYGMMVGLGFQVVEDFNYTSQKSGSLTDVFSFLLQRGLFSGLWSHAALTGIVGGGIGYFVAHKDKRMAKRLGVAVGLFATAWLLHFLFDAKFMDDLFGEGALGFLGTTVLRGLPMVIVLLLVVRWGRTTERKEWSEFVARNIDPSLVPPDDATALLHRSSRRAARKAAAQVGGHQAGAVRKHLQLSQLRYVQSVREEGANSSAAADAAATVRELQAMSGGASLQSAS